MGSEVPDVPFVPEVEEVDIEQEETARATNAKNSRNCEQVGLSLDSLEVGNVTLEPPLQDLKL